MASCTFFSSSFTADVALLLDGAGGAGSEADLVEVGELLVLLVPLLLGTPFAGAVLDLAVVLLAVAETVPVPLEEGAPVPLGG
jgi:hypothetical protein